MKIGIVSSAYLNTDLSSGARRMAAHGWQCSDEQSFVQTENPVFCLPEREFEAHLKEKRAILDHFGIVTHQVHGAWRCPAFDFTPEQRSERFEAMSKAIRGASYLGATYMVIHPMMPFGENSPEHPDLMRQINLEYYARLANVGKEWGVTVCLENMPFPSLPITTPKQVADFAKEIASPYFKVCLDTGHAFTLGITAEQAVSDIGGALLACLHVHDNDGRRDLHLIPGTGVGDWDAFSAALARIGYKGVLSIETSVSSSIPELEREEKEMELARIAKRLANPAS